MTELPVIVRKNGEALWKQGGKEVATGGLASLLSAASAVVDRMPHDPHGLLQYLHIRLYEQKRAFVRKGNPVGRFLNWMNSENPNYIEISATHLVQVLKMAGLDPPKGLSAGEGFYLRHDIARTAYEALRKELG